MILDVLRALGRRWYVVVVGLALTVGLGYGATEMSPPEYNARALVLLLPGENALGDGGNPLLALGGLEQPGSIVVAYFASAAAKEEVAAVSDTANFIVALDATTRGPVIGIDVTDQSAESTTAALDFLLQRVPTELERLQVAVDAPRESIITSMPLVADSEPQLDSSGTVRLGIAAIAVGLGATGLAAFALDGMILRRRARRAAPTEDPRPSSKHAGRTRHGGRDEPDHQDDAPARRDLHDEPPAVASSLDGFDEEFTLDRYPLPVRAGHTN
ncbi:hypothetical protein [Microbacterium invictum]|uniref:Polysaccharide chain length determinant N-terminal domain-containing protein n=1 Tax=Microbacterium invictum TaxID=515415 RepID=A0AA40SPG6_9MICO|nr:MULTISPECIES: hypothetical protein [Microbacterium]MBB4140023.1 hypothetical protein [Microbacterium invictum]